MWRQENAEIRLKVRCPDFLRVTHYSGQHYSKLPKTAQDMTHHEVGFSTEQFVTFLKLRKHKDFYNKEVKDPSTLTDV